MSPIAASEVRTAKVTPAYGARDVGGFGVRGWRSYCPACDELWPPAPSVFDNQFTARRHAENHRCTPPALDPNHPRCTTP